MLPTASQHLTIPGKYLTCIETGRPPNNAWNVGLVARGYSTPTHVSVAAVFQLKAHEQTVRPLSHEEDQLEVS